jgi:type II secretion system protein N
MKEATRRYGGYVLFALAALLLFAWLRMPSEAVRSLVLSALAKNQAEVQIRFDSAQIAFPLGVTLTGVSVQKRDGRGFRIDAETVTAQPALLSLLTGHLALRIQAAAMGGRIEGDIVFRNRFSASGPVQADMKFGNIDAADCPWLAGILGRQIRGRVDGRLRFDGLPGQWTAGSGHLEVALADGLVSFQDPLFGQGEMTFSRMEGNMDMENGTLKVSRFQLDGENMQGTFQGNVRLEGDFSRSRLALRGDVNLPAAGMERFAVEVTGTVANPVVTPI